MHRRFAAWVTGQPWRGYFVASLLAVLAPEGVSPVATVAAATAVLLTLHGSGPASIARGAGVALSSFAVAAGVLLALQPIAVVGVAVFAFLMPWALSVLLLRTGSLNLCYQVAVLGLAAALTGVYAVLDDPSGLWEPILGRLLEQVQAQGLMADVTPEVVAGMARTMWGAFFAVEFAIVLCPLFLGRYWQALLESPGAFGKEFRELRIGNVLGAVALLLVVLAVATDYELIDCLAYLFVAALAFQGLAAAHRRKAEGRMGRGGLIVIYVSLLVLLTTFIMVVFLAAWGAADNWRRQRA